jgi:hypothetical protein
MKRLPTLEDCPECNSQKQDTRSTSVFQCLGPEQPLREHVETSRVGGDPEDEEDRCH